MNRTRHVSLALAAAGLLSLPALAQHSPPPPKDEPAAQPDDKPQQGPDMRSRLQRRLDEVTQEQERLRKALDMLDKGASPEDVMKALAPPGGEGDRPRDRWRDRREGRGPGDGDRPPGPDWRDPAQREKVMVFIRDNLPEVAAHFDQIKATNPDFAERIASRIGPRVMEIMAIQEREPDFAKLKLDELGNGLAIIEAFKQARDAQGNPDKLKDARANLVARVADQFEIRTRLRQHEIDKLRERLDRLQSDLEKQRSQRDADIQKSVDDMMSGKAPMDVLGDGPGRGPRRGPDGPDDHDRPDGPPPGEGHQPPPRDPPPPPR